MDVARKANLFFLAIATLALSEIIAEVIREWHAVHRSGRRGDRRNVSRIEIFGWTASSLENTAATNERNVFWVYLACARER